MHGSITKLSLFIFSMCSSLVDEMDITCSCVHQGASILISSVEYRSCLPAATLKRDRFLPTYSSIQSYHVKRVFVAVNREVFKS